MTTLMLTAIKDSMQTLGINYELAVYTAYPLQYPYFVGEYIEVASIDEDGMQECTFHLNGFTRDSWNTLEAKKALIADYFNKVGGRSFKDANGNIAVIYYSNSHMIPTGDAELKRIQIDLTIKEWTVK